MSGWWWIRFLWDGSADSKQNAWICGLTKVSYSPYASICDPPVSRTLAHSSWQQRVGCCPSRQIPHPAVGMENAAIGRQTPSSNSQDTLCCLLCASLEVAGGGWETRSRGSDWPSPSTTRQKAVNRDPLGSLTELHSLSPFSRLMSTM